MRSASRLLAECFCKESDRFKYYQYVRMDDNC